MKKKGVASDSPSSSEYERAENDESGYEESGIDDDVSKKGRL